MPIILFVFIIIAAPYVGLDGIVGTAVGQASVTAGEIESVTLYFASYGTESIQITDRDEIEIILCAMNNSTYGRKAISVLSSSKNGVRHFEIDFNLYDGRTLNLAYTLWKAPISDDRVGLITMATDTLFSNLSQERYISSELPVIVKKYFTN